MKGILLMKLSKLLPIVALSGIATVAMPLVACSTNGGDTPEPGPATQIELKYNELVEDFVSEKINIEANQQYVMKINTEAEKFNWSFFIGFTKAHDEGSADVPDGIFDVQKMTVDGFELTPGTAEDEDDCHYYVLAFGAKTVVESGDKAIPTEHQKGYLEMWFKFDTSLNDVYLKWKLE